MEKISSRPNPMNHAMRWGLLIGACFAVNFLLSVSGIVWLNVLTYLIEILILVLAWRFAKNYRDQECGGVITFGRAWTYIFLLFFFASLIGGIVKFVYLQWINPEYLANILSQSMIMLEQAKIEIPQDSINLIEQLLTPIYYTFQNIMADMFLGAILGLIYAPFLKRKEIEQTDIVEQDEADINNSTPLE